MIDLEEEWCIGLHIWHISMQRKKYSTALPRSSHRTESWDMQQKMCGCSFQRYLLIVSCQMNSWFTSRAFIHVFFPPLSVKRPLPSKSIQFKDEKTVIRDGMQGTLDMTVRKCKEA